MSKDLSFTGERFLPGCVGEIVYEHWHRYAFATRLAAGRRVLDVACGEGYGSALLSRESTFTLGVDISVEAVAHAHERYSRSGTCAFVRGSCDRLPVASGTFDLIVSFETIEHVDADAQRAMLGEFARVLAPGGSVLLSSPNKALYSDVNSVKNEFHVNELYRGDLAQLLDLHFPARIWFGQKIQCVSAIWSEQESRVSYEAWELSPEGLRPYPGPEPMYYLVAAAHRPEDLPRANPGLSVFIDRGETLQAANVRAQREILRVDTESAQQRRRFEALILERDQTLIQRSRHIEHLEELKAHCEEIVAERDTQIAAKGEHVTHLEALVAERERLIVERDGQLELINGLLRAEQEAHARMVIELREVLQAKADLMSTLSGLEGERTKLLAEVREFRAKLGETEEQVVDFQRMITERDAVVLYRQSLVWWLKLPFARVKMALRGR